jgi:hypothetical protein
MDKRYVDTVRLMLEAAPHIFAGPAFALKGGTALNLFVDEMPRLSVDLDVVYRDHSRERPGALEEISAALRQARHDLAGSGLQSEIRETMTGEETKLFVHRDRLQVKVEVNRVFRGTVLPVESRRLVQTTRDLFTTDLSLPVLAVPELFGSKLVAALDRQHPRDFFDVRQMFGRFGLLPEIVECFVCYLAGHNRPVHEVLFSRDHDFKEAFDNEFHGMTREPGSFEELILTRERLRHELPHALTDSHRQFLVSLVIGEPEWDLMRCPHLSELPALKWKLHNLAKLKKVNMGKFREQVISLEKRFAR